MALHYFTFCQCQYFEKPLKLEEKEVHPISQKTDSYELRYAFFHDSERAQDLFHSARLYNDKNELLQTIEGEELWEHMFWGQIGNTPALVDINEDGYLDLIIKVSAGSLGEFSTIWFFNPDTERYQESLEEILYPVVVGKNLVSSTYTYRQDPFPSNLTVYYIQPDFSFDAESWDSVLIPLKKGDQSYYCLSDPVLNSDGKVNYSLEVRLDQDEKLTPDSLAQFEALNLDEYCYSILSELSYHLPKENYHSLSIIKLPVEKEDSDAKLIELAIKVDPNWATVATNFDNFDHTVTSMNCPIIPHLNLDTKRIEYADLPAFEALPEDQIYNDYGYPVICDYDENPYRG